MREMLVTLTLLKYCLLQENSCELDLNYPACPGISVLNAEGKQIHHQKSENQLYYIPINEI